MFAVTTAFMTLTAANGWITSRIIAALPDGAEAPAPASLVPLDNLMAAVGAQVFVLAAIFAVGSLIVAERHAGTLAWVASKPVSRSAIWLAKWASSTAMLAVSAVVLPLAATVALVVVLYGAPPVAVVAGFAAGMIALVAFFAAVGLMAGTIVPGQPAVIAVGFVVFALLPVLGGILGRTWRPCCRPRSCPGSPGSPRDAGGLDDTGRVRRRDRRRSPGSACTGSAAWRCDARPTRAFGRERPFGIAPVFVGGRQPPRAVDQPTRASRPRTARRG